MINAFINGLLWPTYRCDMYNLLTQPNLTFKKIGFFSTYKTIKNLAQYLDHFAHCLSSDVITHPPPPLLVEKLDTTRFHY